MNLGIRGKLFAISLALITLAALASGALVETVMRGLLLEQVRGELERLSSAAAETLLLIPGPLEVGSAQAVITRLGKRANLRVTVIGSDGRVFADSSLPVEELKTVENHGLRPEVLQAIRSGRGVTTRYSTTVQADMMYMAVPFERPDSQGVVRVSRSLSEVDALISHMRWLLTAAVVLGLLVAIVMGALASYFASRSLVELVNRARAVASAARGARGERLRVGADEDELAGLAGSFNQMADELDRSFETLSQERDLSRAILENLTDGVLALDAQACVTEMNGAALRLLGIERAPFGAPLIEVLRVPALLEIVSQRGTKENASAEFVWPGPPRRTLLATVTPQPARGPRVVVLRDITELRRLELMRRDFVANASHELRTPVSIISANVETLAAGALSDPSRAAEFLGAVQRNAERLSRLVNDLLDLSRIEDGSHTLSLKPTSIEGPVGAVLDLLESRAQEKQIAFEIAVDEDLVVVGDSSALEHVLVNLVDNAIKYTPAGGAVGIVAKHDAGHVLLEVWDTGPGVPESHRARLFERFYRVDPGRSRDMGGTGLGLSIVKHLVETMRGTVHMRPREGGGSVFWVRLPAAAEERSLNGKDASEPLGSE